MPAAARPLAHADIRRGAFRALFAALCGASWIALWLWSASPYARYLEHGGWADDAGLAIVCRALPAAGLWLPALLYVGGWILMIAAMMLPTTFPVLEIVRRVSAGRPNASRLLLLLTLGYLCAWLAFGIAAHVGDMLVHLAANKVPSLAMNGWVIGAAVLYAAGLFQLSALKYRCLEQCRTPMGFVIQRWHGKTPARDALKIGWDHGLFCVGCCWALMLLMFAVGTASIGWMMVLACIMAAEKNLPGGRRLRTPLAAVLLAGGTIIVLLHLPQSAA